MRIGGAWKLLGLAHNAVADRASPNYPTIFTDLTHHISWIQSLLPTSEGYGTFYKTTGASAGWSLLNKSNWSSIWTSIIPGNFGSDGTTDLLFYSSHTGTGYFHHGKATGGMTAVKSRSWRKTWTSITPGNFDGTGVDDLFFYDAGARQAEFYSTDGAGNMKLLGAISDQNKLLSTWRVIIPGNFAGDSLTDLFFYDPVSGAARIYTTNGAATLTLAWTATLSTNWEIIVPGEFNGDTKYTDLMFYNPETDLVKVMGTGINTYGVLTPTAQTLCDNTAGSTKRCSTGSFGKGWQYLKPGSFGGSSLTDFVAYDPITRKGQWLQTNGVTDSSGKVTTVTLSSLRQASNWRTTWSQVVTGNFDNSGYTDVLFYDKWHR